MSVQFLINGFHDDGSPGLVVATEQEWLSIVADNVRLPKEERRYFYRDLIVDGDQYDFIIMEVPKKLLLQWNNAARNVFRSKAIERDFTHISFDFLAEFGYEGPPTEDNIDETIYNNILVDNLRNEVSKLDPWASEVLEMYLLGCAIDTQKHLMSKYKISRTTAYRYQQSFDFFIKNYLKKNETKSGRVSY